MQKIKRTDKRQTSSNWSVFLKTVLITSLCIIMVAVGYFAALYVSRLLG